MAVFNQVCNQSLTAGTEWLSVILLKKTCSKLFKSSDNCLKVKTNVFFSQQKRKKIKFEYPCFFCEFLSDIVRRRIRLAVSFSADFRHTKIRRRIHSGIRYGLGLYRSLWGGVGCPGPHRKLENWKQSMQTCLGFGITRDKHRTLDLFNIMQAYTWKTERFHLCHTEKIHTNVSA